MPTYTLPENLRALLAQPFGPVHQTPGALREVDGRDVLAIGDVVTKTFLDHGLVPKLMLIDGVTQRGTAVADALGQLPSEGVHRVVVENPAATITDELWRAMEQGIEKPGSTLIQVVGEEDLAALPAMILAPEGAVVCYGQPKQGVVVVVVTPEVRQRARDVLNQMEME